MDFLPSFIDCYNGIDTAALSKQMTDIQSNEIN